MPGVDMSLDPEMKDDLDYDVKSKPRRRPNVPEPMDLDFIHDPKIRHGLMLQFAKRPVTRAAALLSKCVHHITFFFRPSSPFRFLFYDSCSSARSRTMDDNTTELIALRKEMPDQGW